MANPIREALNKHKWQTGDLDRVTLVVLHRGAPNDEAFVHGFEIAEIGADGVHLWPDEEGNEGSFIPYHRVRSIRLRDA